MSDIDTVVVDSLKALDPNRPIREADKTGSGIIVRFVPEAEIDPARSRASLLVGYG